MRRAISASLRAIAPLVLILILGCDVPPAMPTEAIFYPPPPDLPRIQFLMSFSDLSQWSRNTSSFADFVVGSSVAASGEIKAPYGVAMRDGKLYICDIGLGKVHVVDLVNKGFTQLGSPGQISKPVNITIAPDGTKYVCDTMARRVAVFDADDNFVRYLGNSSTCNPIDLAISGDEFIVADVADSEVEAWSRDGTFLRIIAEKGTGPGQLRMPTNLDVASDGRIFVTDTVASTINIYTPEGAFTGFIGAPGDRPGFFARPKGIAITPNDNIYIADAQWETVQLFEPEGRLLMYFGGAALGPEGMGMPAGLAVDDTSIDVFSSYIQEDFEVKYLLVVANQFGNNKIGIYAFGESTTATYEPIEFRTATQPTREDAEPNTPDRDDQSAPEE